MNPALRRGIRILGTCLFFVYMAALIYCLFFAGRYGRLDAAAGYRWNLVPFREIRRYLTCREILGTRLVVLNLAGNILGFVPFGALLPLVVRGADRAWKTALVCFEVSALIEVSQMLFRAGCCDVDDVILNTAGGLLGYFIFRICRGLARQRTERTR